jgi:hypothetical protein
MMVGMDEPTIAQRIEHRRLDEVHDCFRPGCPERARSTFYVSGPIMIARQVLNEGDWLDLCWPHYEELKIAANAIPIATFPENRFISAILCQNPVTALAELWA